MKYEVDLSTLPDIALVREKQIAPVLPFSKPTLWRRVKAGLFPAPMKLDGNVTAWRWGDVRAWLESQGGAE